MTTQWIEVEADYHQFMIANADVDTTSVTSTSSVFDSGSGFVVVHTGIAAGPVSVALEILDAAPAAVLDDWDNVSEAAIRSDGSLQVLTTLGDNPPGFEQLAGLGGGTYVLRIHTRGRQANWDMTVESPTEQYLIQIWPTKRVTNARDLRSTDGVWDTTEIAAPAVAFDRPSANVDDATVDLYGPVRWDPSESDNNA